MSRISYLNRSGKRVDVDRVEMQRHEDGRGFGVYAIIEGFATFNTGYLTKDEFYANVLDTSKLVREDITEETLRIMQGRPSTEEAPATA